MHPASPAPEYTMHPASPAPDATMHPAAPTDYGDPAHWLAIPAKAAMRVDVFYVYPTAYSRETPDSPLFSTIDDAHMAAGARSAFSRQATAFAPVANIYAPFYRQIDAKTQLALDQDDQEANIRQVPAVDVTAAFDYYLKHWNHGRPFILVSHSQGSAAVRVLLSDYMSSHPRIYARMVAAYVVGQSITPEYLAASPHLKYATGADDTGVIASWNTEAPVLAAPNPVTEPGGIAIDPITWRRDGTVAQAFQSLGAIELNASTGTPILGEDGQPKRIVGLCDARVDVARGVVVCSTVDPADYVSGFPLGVYHTFDIPFYYFDIRANAANRIEHFLATHPAFRHGR